VCLSLSLSFLLDEYESVGFRKGAEKTLERKKKGEKTDRVQQRQQLQPFYLPLVRTL
jgi:hypothetical protein